MHLLGSKCFSGVTDYATLVHLLKHTSDTLTDRQTHWVDNQMPYANLMRILYTKEILNEADPVSRDPDFLPVDKMRVCGGMEMCRTLILMVMTLQYWHYRH
jgi:hypothetical protein